MAANEKPQVDVPVGQPPSYQLELEDIEVGTGSEAKSGDIVEVHYVGVSWKSGNQFDASWDRGDTFKFGLGKGQVIPGWDQGVAGMKVGGRRRITIPPDLGLRQARRRRRDRARRDARVRRGPHRRSLTAISPPSSNGSTSSIPSPLQKRPGSYQDAGRPLGSSPMCWYVVATSSAQ